MLYSKLTRPRLAGSRPSRSSVHLLWPWSTSTAHSSKIAMTWLLHRKMPLVSCFVVKRARSVTLRASCVKRRCASVLQKSCPRSRATCVRSSKIGRKNTAVPSSCMENATWTSWRPHHRNSPLRALCAQRRRPSRLDQRRPRLCRHQPFVPSQPLLPLPQRPSRVRLCAVPLAQRLLPPRAIHWPRLSWVLPYHIHRLTPRLQLRSVRVVSAVLPRSLVASP